MPLGPEPGWGYFIGRTLIRFHPNYDGTIMRFYFDNGIKLTATARNEDDERDGPQLVFPRTTYRGSGRPLESHPLVVALDMKRAAGGFKVNTVETHARASSNIDPGPDGNDHEYLHSPVHHVVTLKGITPFPSSQRESEYKSEYKIEIKASSDTFVDGVPGWDWSLHDVLFRDGKEI